MSSTLAWSTPAPREACTSRGTSCNTPLTAMCAAAHDGESFTAMSHGLCAVGYPAPDPC